MPSSEILTVGSRQEIMQGTTILPPFACEKPSRSVSNIRVRETENPMKVCTRIVRSILLEDNRWHMSATLPVQMYGRVLGWYA